MRKRPKVQPKPAPPEPRINERIRVPEVRLIDEEGRQVGVVRTVEAIAMARQRDVDLVEVSAQAQPPVARLMDFGRFKYEQSKKDREAKKHQVNVQLREVRMKPKIDDHDVDFKTRTAAKLLKQGDKVKVTVMFRGREITHPQIGKNLLDRVVAALQDVALVEKDAMLEGRHMTIILAADKKKIAAKARALAAAAAATGAPAPVEEEETDEAVLAAAAAAPVVGEENDDEDEADDASEADDAEEVAEPVAATTGD
ncbi:MAG: translation initiation factor IF-3 [Tepidiformaceae bacterium]